MGIYEKELEKQIIPYLITFYEEYLQGASKETLMELGGRIQGTFMAAGNMVSQEIGQFVSGLTELYTNIPELKKPTHEEILRRKMWLKERLSSLLL